MTDRDVRAYLRRITKENIIRGWSNFITVIRVEDEDGNITPEEGPLKWTISPQGRAVIVYTAEEVRAYCFLIKLLGYDPLYITDETPA